ncbi:protein suppressor of forked isoform X2 [Ctenocephalides felis]|uniref:protein suppressor of forked isoform X2 n=1 Tax=Ctenocephalides felis TaxID=7515 RepID=UPI000E6E297A|nr:protein suppressor of forked isoform X2 [Ctenocephalides felis]
MAEATEEKLDIDWGNERLNQAQSTVLVDSYDIESWTMLVREAQARQIEDVRIVYEKLIQVFPTTARYWKIYIEQEMKGRNFERVEKLFQRCLVKILNIDLWKLYLAYVKETKAALSTYKEKMAQAYDFALEKIGMDIHSYSIWCDYICFLKSVEAVGSYAENQKISAVRKVYQKAVVTPIIGIEHLWKDYISFERGINLIIAEKMGMERSRDYMNARRVAKELECVIRGLNKNLPAVPPTLNNEEVKQVELWKKFIAWEQSNPLRSEDTALVTRRVMFAIEQCLLCLAHHPAVWHQAAQYLEHSSKVLTEKGDINAARAFSDEAASILERAITGALSRSALLYFAYADYEEGRLKHDKVHQIYGKYLEIPDIDPTLAYVQYMKFARRAEGIKSARQVFKKAREDQRSKYHVFVAAALMEYYCSKDKNIAFRIFELGLKKFSDSPEYVMCYIDYLSHLNEDNNTRVLFERVLSSGHLSAQHSVEIWNRFLEFESNIGDLASIVKTEKRRSAVLEKLKEFEGKDTAQLVDRYKFLNLYPCSASELKSIGYTEILSATSSLVGQKSVSGVLNFDSDDKSAIPRPDFSQMIPYKPKFNTVPGDHPIPGGVFPMPPGLAQLTAELPPPSCFHGPFVSIDLLLEHLDRLALANIQRPTHDLNSSEARQFDMAKSVHWIVDDTNGMIRKRRKVGGEDSDDDDINGAPPTHDIYRQRQQKRVK